MTTVTVSPKFQVVIPQIMRDALGIRPGQRIQALQYQDRIELIPVRPMRKARGMLKGIDTTVNRERNRS
jgi:AbrB family looped-hinge helix DNA binding protein